MNHACPRCGTTTTKPGRCTRCARPENQRKNQRATATVYQSPRWRALRELVLHRDGYTCRECGRRANHAGHHVPFKDANDWLAWAPTNVIALCATCNGREAGTRRQASRAHDA